jgi:hypothetical protein
MLSYYHHQWHYSPESVLGLPYGFSDDITMWVISPTIDLILVILIRHNTVKQRRSTDGFTSPPKEGVLLILSPFKIHRPRPGLNPRTLGPVASTLTTTPPRAT